MEERKAVKKMDSDAAATQVDKSLKPEDRGDIVFYCKDCGKLVGAEKVGMKYVYKCKVCKTKNVAFGTEASIRKFFHIPEDPSATKTK